MNFLLAAEEAGAVSPFLVGGVTLVIFVSLITALFIFGKGREHS